MIEVITDIKINVTIKVVTILNLVHLYPRLTCLIEKNKINIIMNIKSTVVDDIKPPYLGSTLKANTQVTETVTPLPLLFASILEASTPQ